MLSYTSLRNRFAVLANTTNSTVLTNADAWINDAHRIFISKTNGYFTEATGTETSVASQQAYALPYNCEKINSVTFTIDDFKYPLIEVNSRKDWDELQMNTAVTADPPQYYYQDAGKLYLWPTPASASNTINFNYKKRVIDLNTADITTSTITTLANGSTALTVSAGLTAQMPGFWIRPTFSTTANTGDGNWYEIYSVTSATVAVLVREYGGVSIAAGTAASTIAQMPLIPEIFHSSLVDYAISEYWEMNGDSDRASAYRAKWNNALEEGAKYSLNKTTNMVIDDGCDREILNPNLTVML